MESVCGAICKLRLQSNILRSAENFRKDSGLGENYYGLQIRKTDFGAGGADDDALFDLVQKAGDKKFFVCSDNKEVEARFRRLQNVAIYEKKAYVEKLVPGEWTALAADHSGRVYPCNVNRSAQSVVDAVVDLLVLSYSQVVKTSNSTFLNAALLLKAARGIAPKSQAEPRALSLSRHESKPASRAVYVYNTWHLGDLMLALHLLRALAIRHKEAHFYFFIHQRYISQLQEMIAGKMRKGSGSKMKIDGTGPGLCWSIIDGCRAGSGLTPRFIHRWISSLIIPLCSPARRSVRMLIFLS
jgi:hypothetical protein